MKVFSAEQIRAWDEFSISHEPVSSIDLMERAAGLCTGWLLKNFSNNSRFHIFLRQGKQ